MCNVLPILTRIGSVSFPACLVSPDWRTGSSRCPRSGTQLVARTFVIRNVEESDRAKWDGWVRAEEERGEFDMAQMTRDNLRKREREEGQGRVELVCPICQRRFLVPIAKGTSRTHTRWGVRQSSWDRVRQIRMDIQALEAELDRELDRLEEECDSD